MDFNESFFHHFGSKPLSTDAAATDTTVTTDATPAATPAPVPVDSWWKYYKKNLIRPMLKPILDGFGGEAKQDPTTGEEVRNPYMVEDVVGAAIPLAIIATVGGVAARRRSKKSKTVKSMSDTFQSGISTLKSLQSLSFGRKRRSRRRSHKRKTHRR